MPTRIVLEPSGPRARTVIPTVCRWPGVSDNREHFRSRPMEKCWVSGSDLPVGIQSFAQPRLVNTPFAWLPHNARAQKQPHFTNTIVCACYQSPTLTTMYATPSNRGVHQVTFTCTNQYYKNVLIQLPMPENAPRTQGRYLLCT